MTEIRIQKKELLDTLLRLRRSFKSKYVHLPICNYYCFQLEGTRMSVTVYDTDGMWTTEAVELNGDAIAYDGEAPRHGWCVHKSIVSILKLLEDQEITMKVMDYQLVVVHKYGEFSVTTEDASVYPTNMVIDRWRKTADIHRLTVEAPGMRRWLETLRIAMSEDCLRPMMNGIAVKLSCGQMALCASDGHLLACIHKNIDWNNDTTQIVIPKRAVDVLMEVIPATGMLDISFNTYRRVGALDEILGYATVDMKTDDGHTLQLFFKQPQGVYPDFESVIPHSQTSSISVDRRMLVNALLRTEIFGDYARFAVSEKEIGITADDGEFGSYDSSSENIPCEAVKADGLPMIIRLNPTKAVKLLKRIKTEKVSIGLIDKTRPVIFCPEPQQEVESLTMLIMPMYSDED